jgi:hypothetical protein
MYASSYCDPRFATTGAVRGARRFVTKAAARISCAGATHDEKNGPALPTKTEMRVLMGPLATPI